MPPQRPPGISDMTKTRLLRAALALTALGALTACADLRQRLASGSLTSGYLTSSYLTSADPGYGAVADKDTTTPNQLADRLSQIARLSLIGDDWVFEDESNRCTITILGGDTRLERRLSLRQATFAIRRDKDSGKYYAVLKNRGQVRLDHDGSDLRLFETDSYHGLSIAQSHLLALAQKCAASLVPRA